MRHRLHAEPAALGAAGVIKMKLSDTVDLMNSADWKDRFIAEYIQLVIRMIKLEESLNNLPEFMSDEIAKALLMKQYDAMQSYKLCLEKRAVLAEIDLNSHNRSQS